MFFGGLIRLNRAVLTVLVLLSVVVLAIGFMSSCGSGSGSGTPTPTPTATPTPAPNTPGTVTKVKTRAFVTDSFSSPGSSFSGLLTIDYSKDFILQAGAVSLSGSGAAQIISTPLAPTLVYTDGDAGISVVDNTTEAESSHLALGAKLESIVVSSDSKTAYAAAPAASPSLAVVNIASATTTTTISVPGARNLVLSHNNSRLLVFSDDGIINGMKHSFAIINTTDTTIPPVYLSGAPYDVPVSAVFSADDSRAYILSCGGECGGLPADGTANVTVLDMTVSPPVPIGASVLVAGATTGLLDNSGNLLVAGTPPSGAGQLSILNTSTLVVSKVVTIGDGYHNLMISAGNKLWIGAKTSCTHSCLSIVDTAAGSAAVGGTNQGDVTEMAAIPNRTVVYVAEGGKLRIYDSTTNAETSASPLQFTGRVLGVKVVNQ